MTPAAGGDEMTMDELFDALKPSTQAFISSRRDGPSISTVSVEEWKEVLRLARIGHSVEEAQFRAQTLERAYEMRHGKRLGERDA